MQHATPPDNKDPNAPWYHMPANGLGETPSMTCHLQVLHTKEPVDSCCARRSDSVYRWKPLVLVMLAIMAAAGPECSAYRGTCQILACCMITIDRARAPCWRFPWVV